MNTGTETAIASVAARQLGHVTRDQLVQAGLSSSTVWRRCRSGLLVPAGHRTYRVASAPASPEGDLMATCLDLGARASHRSGAWMRGWIDRPEVIEVLVLRPAGRWSAPSTGPGVIVHSTTDLPGEDRTVLRRIPTVSAARNLMTLGAVVPEHLTQEELTEVLARACESGEVSERWLLWLLERRRIQGRDGVTAFEEALAARLELGPTESWLERTVLRILDGAGLPLPRTQHRVARRGRFVARVDFAYDEPPVVMEALGYRHHRTEADLERDTRRVNRLQRAGKKVIQWSYRQVMNDPDSLIEDVTDTLGLPFRAAA